MRYASDMDAFGLALQTYAAGDLTTEIVIERDDGWKEAHSPGVYFAKDPLVFERPALAHLREPVLDIGCGAGRTLAWCARNGIAARGLDASPGAVAVCHARGLTEVTCHDILKALPPTFPQPKTILLFGNNIGIGGSFDGACLMLRSLREVVAPGGQLLLTGLDVAQTETPAHLRYHARNSAAGRRRGEILIRCHYGDASSAWFPWYHAQPNEISDLAKESGWHLAEQGAADSYFWARLTALG